MLLRTRVSYDSRVGRTSIYALTASHGDIRYDEQRYDSRPLRHFGERAHKQNNYDIDYVLVLVKTARPLETALKQKAKWQLSEGGIFSAAAEAVRRWLYANYPSVSNLCELALRAPQS